MSTIWGPPCDIALLGQTFKVVVALVAVVAASLAALVAWGPLTQRAAKLSGALSVAVAVAGVWWGIPLAFAAFKRAQCYPLTDLDTMYPLLVGILWGLAPAYFLIHNVIFIAKLYISYPNGPDEIDWAAVKTALPRQNPLVKWSVLLVGVLATYGVAALLIWLIWPRVVTFPSWDAQVISLIMAAALSAVVIVQLTTTLELGSIGSVKE